MDINVYSIINIVSLVAIIVLIPQIVMLFIVGKIMYHNFKLLQRLQFTSLAIAVILHWWMLAVLILCTALIIVASGLVLNGRRTVYILAHVLHLHWIENWVADEIIYIDSDD